MMARPGSYGFDLVGGGQGSTPRKGRRCTMEEKLSRRLAEAAIDKGLL